MSWCGMQSSYVVCPTWCGMWGQAEKRVSGISGVRYPCHPSMFVDTIHVLHVVLYSNY